MESVFMPRTSCSLSSPPPPQPFYCPTQTKSLTGEERKITLSPARAKPVASDHHSDMTTPTTHWHLQPVYSGGGGEEEEEEEGGRGDSSSSQYDESWQTSSSVGMDGGREGGERRGAKEGEKGWRGGHGSGADVDGATGQSTIAKFIDRFRRAPPTPREDRRQQPLGSGGTLWWQGPSRVSTLPSPSPQQPSPSPPLSHSTPSSSPASRGGETPSNNMSTDDSLEGRSEQALQKSSSLLASSSNTSLPPPSQTAPPERQPQLTKTPSPHLPSLAPEEDILYQWRLRRRLEQARSQTAGLRARLEGGGAMFKARPVGQDDTPGGGGGVGGTGEHPSATSLPRPSPPQSQGHLLSGSLCPHCDQQTAVSTAPPVAHHPPPLLCHTAPPVAHHPPPLLCHTAPPVAHHPRPLLCHTAGVAPHRHMECDIIHCPRCSHGHTHTHPAQDVTSSPHGGEREEVGRTTPEVGGGEQGDEGEEGGQVQRRGRGGGLVTEVPPEQHLPHGESHGEPRRREVSEGANRPAPVATARPAVRYPSPSALEQAVRYPSPSALEQLRHSFQAHQGHWRPQVPEEEASCLSEEVVSSFSETLGSEGSPVPAHSEPEHSSRAAIGEVVSQAVQQHLFHAGATSHENSVRASGKEVAYSDMGDGLLRALIARAAAFEEQIRQIDELFLEER